MEDDDHHPELAGYVPSDGRPLRHPMTLTVMRVVVVLGVAGLIVPGLVFTIGTQIHTADVECQLLVTANGAGAPGAVARFELMGGDGPGWYCYAKQFDGTELLLAPMGLIPGGALTPAGNPA